jgi:beta-mannosidase
VRIALHEGWQLARSAPGAITDPEALSAAGLAWQPAQLPGTVASSLGHDLSRPGPFDADDWWYRTTFTAPASAAGARHFLRFEGLATLATAWLNGERILVSRNMFTGHRVEVTGRLRDVNHLAIRFESLAAALAQRRPRPRWRTALVEKQNLRWFRTTLLGRMPGWTPPIDPVGPWQPVYLDCAQPVDVAALNLQARAEDGAGRVQLRATVVLAGGTSLDDARIRIGESVHALHMVQGQDARIHGDLTIPGVPLWWPHTHGEPARVPWTLELRVDDEWIAARSGELGFKALGVDTTDGATQLVVNRVPVFCRGAVWTPLDFLRLRSEPKALRAALESARDAGVNMLRVGGTMAYECEEFYAACDALGIMVWQDFMFANMDYPVGDRTFRADVEAEVRCQLERLHRHPCIAAYCGGSEVAQQAAMLGLPADHWTNDFFAETVPRLCSIDHAGIPYFPSSPWGGALPFHVGTGIAHYYGVGAYRRPLADVKAARVKFATECLGFSHLPEPETVESLTGSNAPPPHHPLWKARVPRDNGSGWDFEDVRDHYLAELFGVDPQALRSQDLERYHALSRVVPGEVMRRVFAEWRSPASRCGGALVWLMRDLWPGAGWGVVDSHGRPKASFWCLKRAWQPRSVHITDEGMDGLAVHVVNEAPEPLEATVRLELFREGRVAMGSATRTVRVGAHAAITLGVDAMIGTFTDCNNAYRFGPPKHDVVAARLTRTGTDDVLGEDHFFPVGWNLPMQHGAAMETQVEALADGRIAVRVRSEAFLQSVAVSCDGYVPDDNYFHLSPMREKTLVFAPAGDTRAFSARLVALNRAEAIHVRLGAATGIAAQRPSAA